MEGAVGIFSDKVIGLESWKKKAWPRREDPVDQKAHGFKHSTAPGGLAKAGLKFQGHIYKPNWLKRLSMWTLQGKSAAHFSEFINTLALARKPWRTQCFSSKCAGIWVSPLLSSSQRFPWCRTDILRLLENAGVEKTRLSQPPVQHLPKYIRVLPTATSSGLCHYMLDLLTFICKTYPPQSCASKSLKHIQPIFSNVSGLRVSLNPDTASISSLWTTHLRHMCRNLTKKKRGSVKRRNMHTWPSSLLHF